MWDDNCHRWPPGYYHDYESDEDEEVLYAPIKSIKPIVFNPESINPQFSSPLFTIIPPEIRSSIIEYSLKDYENESHPYDDTTCYKRPDCLAPRKSDTALLRTCKKMYMEGWWRPYASAEHVFYLTAPERSPPQKTLMQTMQKSLNELYEANAEPWFEHVRIFAQLCPLEDDGLQFRSILEMKHFNPKSITLTIRHTDWWNWEDDQQLCMGADWVRLPTFPESLKEFNIAFESLERKKEQVDEIVQQAIENWEFWRKDEVVFSAEGCIPAIMRWSGGSTWEGRRWLRDETTPGRLEYYVATVTWKPVYVKTLIQVAPEHEDVAISTATSTSQAGGSQEVTEEHIPDLRNIKRKTAKALKASETHEPLITRMASIAVSEMVNAGIPLDALADECIERWELSYREEIDEYMGLIYSEESDDYL